MVAEPADEVVAQAGSPWPYTQPTWVFTSRSLLLIEGADIRLARGEVRPVHAAMRAAAGEKNIWIVGGGELVGQFFDAGLLDELIVQIGSVTLGKGKALLPRRITSPPLRLVSAQYASEGCAELSRASRMYSRCLARSREGICWLAFLGPHLHPIPIAFNNGG